MAGVRVVWAANHWRAAVEIHEANHPGTAHGCQDLQQADWTQVPKHDLLLASPACQGHSPARGKDRPHHDAARATAWAVVACAECHRPARLIVENVEAFADWVLFPSWRDALERLGYGLTLITADAADAGVPQNRRRLFVCGWLGGARRVVMPRREHVPAAAILSSEEPRSPWRTLCERTRRRIEAGRRVHGDRFLISYYGTASGGRSLARPMPVVTTVERHALVVGDLMRMLTVEEYRAAMGFPAGYVLPDRKRDAVRMLGNAVPPPLARDVILATQ